MSAYEDFVASTSPLAWWKTDNTSTIEMNNYGSAGSSLRAGLLGSGWFLDQPSLVPNDPGGKAIRTGSGGSGGYGSVGLSTSRNDSEFTAHVWFQADQYQNSSGSEVALVMAQDLDGAYNDLRWRVYFANTGQLVVLYRNADATVVGHASPGSVSLHDVHLLGLQLKAGKFRFWLDGAPFSPEFTVASLYSTNGGRFEVGTLHGAFSTSTFVGVTQHFIYHNSALSESTMEQMYLAGTADLDAQKFLLGDTEPSKLYLGTAQSAKGYLGTNLLWSHFVPTAVTDVFSRHPAGDLTGKVTETGQTWVNIAGTAPEGARPSAYVDSSGRIQGNYGRTMSYVDVGSRNGTFTGTVAQVNPWENWPSCAVGATATGDRYYLEISGSNVYLERVVAGALTNLAIFGAQTNLANGDVFKMCIQQIGPLTNRITIKQNGVVLLAGGGAYYDDTDATYVPNGTYAGVGSEQVVGWSNFRFDPNEIL